MQTPVTFYLEQEGVEYRLLPHTKPAKTIDEAALERGVNPEQMVKSILLRDMGGFHVLACVPGPAQVDPKKVRAMFGCRRMTCADASDVEKVTGLVIGTVAPVGLKRPLPVIFDHSIKKHHKVNISSGDRMAGVELETEDLLLLCDPMFADICR
ncbi:aminoacyl-tRNA deacylase [Photobacterium alginatilyticum]|uniref:YbaK/EbsC family protein n=1 Tax=Photobacterium alginatilyticum TaxID=1775171 RepID=A0ABW9YKR4_9GAMM|nr:YbaK/EbsC family protein [Photobacterium alginatilyticum]NBI54376.1 YbaK/EbsC family protein [Photobacterium alginatilyticum]